MSTNLDDAFTDSPPVLNDGRTLKPLSEMIYRSIVSAARKVDDGSDMVYAGLYIIAASRSPFEAGKMLASKDAAGFAYAECMTISESEFDDVLAYMNRVIDRRNAAQVEVEESTPGKQDLENHQGINREPQAAQST